MRNIFKDPLFHVARRRDIPWWKALMFRLIAILVGIIFVCLILAIASGANPLLVIPYLFKGNFGTPRKIWISFHTTALLLLVALGLLPAFKMKFWNLGGDGQILVSALVGVMLMHGLGDAGWPDGAIIALMIPCSIAAGAIWALIPAIFKAFFNTNESLFTLMMNYIAAAIVGVYITAAFPNNAGSMPIIETGNFPTIFGLPYLLTIIIAVLVLALVFGYLRFSKHGYELEVVGESQNTAKYIGINVKKVVIRTALLSGAICGVVGLLIAGSIDRSITTESANGMGFTAIMVAWLARFNPFAMVGTAFLVSFVTNGMPEVRMQFGITSSAITSVSIGLIYFFIIAVEFLISYRVIFNKRKAKTEGAPKEKASVETKEEK